MLAVGIDIGTTGCKAVAVDERGTVAGSGYRGYPLATAPGGRVEQDPGLWLEAMALSVRQALEGLDPGRVAALSLSTQGASSLLVDENFAPLTPALTWMDTRAAGELPGITAELDAAAIYRASGWRPLASLDMAKARWLAAHEPELVRRARMFVSTMEYAVHFLCGEAAVDPTNAAIRQLMDIRSRASDPRLLSCARLDAGKLPPILPCGSELGRLTAGAAAELGLPRTVRVFMGAHDQYCGALGASILRPGELLLSTGTAWVILAVSGQAVYSDSYISPGPHVLPGLYGALASLPAAGAALDWLRGRVTGGEYGEIDAEAARRLDAPRPDVQNALYFLPYLARDSFPPLPAGAGAAFIGLDMGSDRHDMALACMEGAVFQLRRALDEFRACGIGVEDVHVTGGATVSPVWMRILSANLGARLRRTRVKDAPCVGAACIAGVGAGLFADYAGAAALINPPEPVTAPEEALAAYYEAKYRHFCALSRRLYGKNVDF